MPERVEPESRRNGGVGFVAQALCVNAHGPKQSLHVFLEHCFDDICGVQLIL